MTQKNSEPDMEMADRYTPRPSGLPDPDYHAEFYADVPSKRLMAWVIDTILIAAVVFLISLTGFLLPLIIFPILFAIVGFLYRWPSRKAGAASISHPSARLCNAQNWSAPMNGACG